MSVAVIIVNYNSASLLERCLQCLSNQTCQPDQIIVVDNASTEPASIRLLQEITGAEVIHAGANLGYGAAINPAVETLSDVEYVCCLNPDAFPKPDWLEKLTSAAAVNPAYGSFACLMLNAHDESTIDGAGDELHLTGLPWRRFHGRKLADTHIGTEPVLSPCAGAAMYRVDDFRSAGGFDESFSCM